MDTKSHVGYPNKHKRYPNKHKEFADSIGRQTVPGLR